MTQPRQTHRKPRKYPSVTPQALRLRFVAVTSRKSAKPHMTTAKLLAMSLPAMCTLVNGNVLRLKFPVLSNDKLFFIRSLGVALPGKLYPNGYVITHKNVFPCEWRIWLIHYYIFWTKFVSLIYERAIVETTLRNMPDQKLSSVKIPRVDGNNWRIDWPWHREIDCLVCHA